MLTLLILVVVMLGCHRQRCLGSQAMPADPARRTPGRSLRPEEEVVVVVGGGVGGGRVVAVAEAVAVAVVV